MVAPDIRVIPAGELAATAANAIAGAITATVQHRGRCRLALAGGSTPVPIYRQLSRRKVPWAAVELFFGDERAVPPDDPGSNCAMAHQALIDRVAIPPANVHRIHGELDPDVAAERYRDELGEAPIDVLLLGMGGDGHTASLFPGSDGQGSDDRVVATTSPVPPHPRISLGYRAINEARTIYLLVAGAGKAARLAEVHEQITSQQPTLPAARVQPESGQLFWLIDDEAASALTQEGRQ